MLNCDRQRETKTERERERQAGVYSNDSLTRQRQAERDRDRERESRSLGCYQNLRNLKSIHQTQRLQLIFSARSVVVCQAKRAGGSINKCSAASPVRLVRVQHIRSRSLSSSSSPPLDPPFRGPSNVQKKKEEK